MSRLMVAVMTLIANMGLSASGLAQSPTAETIAKVKEATVFIKMRHGEIRATGSGFLVRSEGDTGYIVTNNHVIDPYHSDREAGESPTDTTIATVDVVFRSGTPRELTRRATIVATDVDRDLALLKIVVAKESPKPLVVDDAPKLLETMKVYVCGFPFGARLSEGDKNPEISIGEASISSIRTNTAGQIASIQLNGALNPGNS
ncbi:MAG: S1 family peptidase, partial [Gemmataceae bacterium]